MATIRKLKNDSYQVSGYIQNKRIRKCFPNYNEAKTFKLKLENESLLHKQIKNGLVKPRIDIKSEILNIILSRIDIKPKTFVKYKYFVSQFQLFCENYKIVYADDFTKEHADIFNSILIRPRKDPKGSTDRILKAKPKTINFYLTMARSFFNELIKRDIINSNPFNHIKNLKAERKIPEYYSADELKRFFSQPMSEAVKNVFLMLLNSGMRFGELANLRWADIDLEQKLITIRERENFSPKTKNSNRTIPMNNVVYKLILSLYEKNKNITSDDFVIKSEKGCQIRERYFYAVCNKIGKKAGIAGSINLHKFRHTFASHLVQRGVRIEELQKLLGHSSIKETLIYAHIQSQTLHSKVNLLENLF